jgi:hypothetical protein
MRPLERTYFITDVLEDTARAQRMCQLQRAYLRTAREQRMCQSQRTYPTDVLEVTARAQNVIRTCLSAVEPAESAALAFIVCECLKRKKNRKWRVHPIIAVTHCDEHF